MAGVNLSLNNRDLKELKEGKEISISEYRVYLIKECDWNFYS